MVLRRCLAHDATVCLLLLFVLMLGRTASAAEQPADEAREGKRFLRVERNKQGDPLALQTAIVSFESAKADQKGIRVDLIGAVHVGEKSYYDALNKAFEGYDVVLYELVAPAGTRIAKGSKPSGHPVAVLQNALKFMLGLEHQLEYVDYSKENLVHADMSPADFAKSMQDRNESFWTMFFRMMGQGIARQAQNQTGGNSSDIDLLLALFDKNRAVMLKRVMAEQFEGLEGMMDAFSGPDGSTIITERNKVALAGLAKELANGKKHLAIFYGAGHLPDMEQRLKTDFGFERTGERWLDAWTLGDSSRPAHQAATEKEPAAAAAGADQ